MNENSTVVSTSNGNIVTQTMTTEDFQQVDELEDESGEYEDFDVDTDTGYNDDSDTDSNAESNELNIIRIEFEDSLGNSKEIIVKYK